MHFQRSNGYRLSRDCRLRANRHDRKDVQFPLRRYQWRPRRNFNQQELSVCQSLKKSTGAIHRPATRQRLACLNQAAFPFPKASTSNQRNLCVDSPRLPRLKPLLTRCQKPIQNSPFNPPHPNKHMTTTKTTGVNLSADIWSDDNKLRAAFSWLTRIGVAPKFGSIPIGYYQQDQCKAIDAIVTMAGRFGLGATRLRCKSGYIQAYQPEILDAIGKPLFRAQWRNIALIVCGKLSPCEIPSAYAQYLQKI